jgi:hypothetical protein
MEAQTTYPLAGLILPAFLWVASGIVAYLLAKEKGRNVVLWTVLGFIPFLNFPALMFFIGASNLTLEKKLDAFLASQERAQTANPVETSASDQ